MSHINYLICSFKFVCPKHPTHLGNEGAEGDEDSEAEEDEGAGEQAAHRALDAAGGIHSCSTKVR